MISVEAMDCDFKNNKASNKASFSDDNAFVSVYSKGINYSLPIFYDCGKKNGSLKGFDIKGDGKVNIPLSDLANGEIIEKFAGLSAYEAKKHKEFKKQIYGYKVTAANGEKLRFTKNEQGKIIFKIKNKPYKVEGTSFATPIACKDS